MKEARSFVEIKERVEIIFHRDNESSIELRRRVLESINDIAGQKVTESTANGRIEKIYGIIQKRDNLGISLAREGIRDIIFLDEIELRVADIKRQSEWERREKGERDTWSINHPYGNYI